MIEIIEASVQGFCKGVTQALTLVDQTLQSDCPRPITILGSLVHNDFVNQSLKEKGVRVLEAKQKSRLELLDQIDSGTVIFTAHGVSDQVRQKANDKGLHIVDASCPFVRYTQNLMAKHLAQDEIIFYIGKKGHPEAEGATFMQENVYLIETITDIPTGIDKPIFVTNQTTMSIIDLQRLFEAIQSRYPQAVLCDEICNATRIRQKAVLDLANQNIDLLIVVGDPASNNTRKLAQIGKTAQIPQVIQLEDASGLQPNQFVGIKRVAITSGASTPAFLKEEIIEKIKEIDQNTL